LAVAPLGSVLLAVEAGADFEAVDDLAAAGAEAVVAAGAAVAAAAGAEAGAESVVAAAAGLLLVAFWTPPWPLQAPFPVAEEVVPSLQVVGVVDDAGAGAAVAGAAGAAAGAVAEAAFWTPPWPLQAPLPVAEEVVPSLQVVAAVESAAQEGSDNANNIKGAAMSPTRSVFFMKVHSLV
jgi:hypothetical protein